MAYQVRRPRFSFLIYVNTNFPLQSHPTWYPHKQHVRVPRWQQTASGPAIASTKLHCHLQWRHAPGVANFSKNPSTAGPVKVTTTMPNPLPPSIDISAKHRLRMLLATNHSATKSHYHKLQENTPFHHTTTLLLPFLSHVRHQTPTVTAQGVTCDASMPWPSANSLSQDLSCVSHPTPNSSCSPSEAAVRQLVKTKSYCVEKTLPSSSKDPIRTPSTLQLQHRSFSVTPRDLRQSSKAM